MPTTPRTVTRAGKGSSGGGGGGGGSAGMFGYHTITPVAGNATIDIAVNGAGTTCFKFRLVLNATAVNVLAPIWTGGSIVAGLALWIYCDQDATGGRVSPTFVTGTTGDFATDIPLQQLDGTPSTRSVYILTYHGTRWCLDVQTVPTGMAIS